MAQTVSPLTRERAKVLAHTGHLWPRVTVKRTGQTAYLIPSTSAPDVAYYTTSFGCTCPGNRNRGNCIHQEAVAQYEARQRVIAIQTKAAPEAVEERRAYLAELIAEQARQASLLRTQGIRPIDDGDFMRRDEWIQKLRASLPPVTFRS